MKKEENSAMWGSLAASGLPSYVKFCSRCVISNQKPITSFESSHKKNDAKNTTNFTDGVCDACRWAEAKENSIDWPEREKQLIELCDKYRKSDGSFDVVVPASGGKDSRYVAHLLKNNYGMNPLTVTWKPHIFTPIGFENFVSLIDNGNANVLYSPPGDVQRRLTSLAFKNLGHPFQPFIVGQRVVGPKTALLKDIKLVFYGENVAEYGNKIKDNYSPLMDPALYTCFDFKPSNLDNYLLAGLSIRDLIENHGFSLNSMEYYKSPSNKQISNAGVEVHYMSYYKKWVPQDNYYYAVEKTGFKPNEKRKDGSFSRYSGIDDILEDLHYYMQYIKFGMGRATWDAAQEIRSGKLERNEGVALVKKYDKEVPSSYLSEILDYLELSELQFWRIIDAFRPKHLWKRKKDGTFSLKNEII